MVDVTPKSNTDSGMLFVDVDGTLLMWPGKAGRVPRKGEEHYGEVPNINRAMLETIYEAMTAGRQVVIWSTGGTDHAKMAATLCGLVIGPLDEEVTCIGKPNVCYDDGDPCKRVEVRRPPK